jgi:hypothetical protein
VPPADRPNAKKCTDRPTDVALIANAIDNGPDGLLDLVDGRRGFQQVLVITAGDKITVADLEGEILIEHTRPAPGLTYVGNGRPRGPGEHMFESRVWWGHGC